MADEKIPYAAIILEAQSAYSLISCPAASGTRANVPRPQLHGETKQKASSGPYAAAVSVAPMSVASSFATESCDTGGFKGLRSRREST